MRKLPSKHHFIISPPDRSVRHGYSLREFDVNTTQEAINQANTIITGVLEANDPKRYVRDTAKKLATDVGEYVVNNVFRFRESYNDDQLWKHVIKEYLINYVFNIRKLENVEGELRIALAKVITWYNSLEKL